MTLLEWLYRQRANAKVLRLGRTRPQIHAWSLFFRSLSLVFQGWPVIPIAAGLFLTAVLPWMFFFCILFNRNRSFGHAIDVFGAAVDHCLQMIGTHLFLTNAGLNTLVTVALVLGFRRKIGRSLARIVEFAQRALPRRIPGDPFGLWVGRSTGILAELGHGAGLAAGGDLVLELRDAAKNLSIYGETGTGKTTRILMHLLIQALAASYGAIIFDIRGDFEQSVVAAGKLTSAPVLSIGVGRLGINLLAGLTPNTAAGFLEAAFRLLGQGKGESGFWVSLAVTRCEQALTVLSVVDGQYSLSGLQRFVFNPPFRESALATARAELTARTQTFGDRDLSARRLAAAIEYEDVTVASYTEKEFSGVMRTIETAVGRFSDPELQDAFCSSETQADLRDVLCGAVFVVHLPRERFKAAAQVVYMFIKERFFNMINTRVDMPMGAPRRERPVMFMCDEYQQIASAGDVEFFDKSRALNVVGIVASQSLDAYINAIGDEHAAVTLMSNFPNIIAFRSTPRTMDWVCDRLGDVDVERRSTSYSTSSGAMGGTSYGVSISLQRLRVLTAQTFRTLRPDQAVALLTIGGLAFDDVIFLPQITVNDVAWHAQNGVPPRRVKARAKAFIEREKLATPQPEISSGPYYGPMQGPGRS